jgi:hypothetical protein
MGNDPDCPYLLRETLTWRESLDLSKNAPMRVTVMWHCAHPFHGIRLDLGDDPSEVQLLCAACVLPLAGAPAARDESQARGCRSGADDLVDRHAG